jgi:hypothetical protein
MIYSIKGTVIDEQSKSPINGAKISISSTEHVSSDENGDFIINGDIPENEFISLIISSPGYQFEEPAIYKGDNTIKNNIGIIQLQPLIPSIEQDKIKSSQLDQSQVKNLTKGKKDASYYSQEIISNQVNVLKNTLLPSVLTMIAPFGLSQINNISPQEFSKYIDQATCPTTSELDNLIKRKNQLVKQLNNSLNLINNTTKALGITGGIIETLNVVFQVLKNIPIPSAVAGVGLPINVILAVQDNKERIDKLIGKLRNVNVGILSIIIILRQTLIQIIQLLNLLDQLIQECYPDAEQEKIAFELNQLTQQQSNQLDPVVTNVNGFEMGVETEITEKPLKRRRAFARNKQGVVMLKGEWSFSSIDQILIDELVFYIQQNDLKAD